MGYISKCEHGISMALCRKCFPDVSEHNDWSNYQYTHPVKEPAKQRYDKCMEDGEESNPIERLRFFLSCALSGQDWIDVEPFIDAIAHPVKELTDEEIAEIYHSENRVSPQGNFAYYGFARAILRKAQE